VDGGEGPGRGRKVLAQQRALAHAFDGPGRGAHHEPQQARENDRGDGDVKHESRIPYMPPRVILEASPGVPYGLRDTLGT